MIPDYIIISPISKDDVLTKNALAGYLAKKAARNVTVKAKKNILSIFYPNSVSDITFTSGISSCCLSADQRRVAVSLEDKTIHSFTIPEKPSSAITADSIKNAKYLTKHMCFGEKTLVTVNEHEIICADLDTKQRVRFELEGFDSFGRIVKILPTGSPGTYVLFTENEPGGIQAFSLKLTKRECTINFFS